MNNTTIKHLMLAALAAIFLANSGVRLSAEEPTAEQAIPPEVVKIFIMDDQSGPELKRFGIESLKKEDIESWVKYLKNSKVPVKILHQMIDDDVSDNANASLSYKPPTISPPELPDNAEILPDNTLFELLQKYQETSTEWNSQREKRHKELDDECQLFVRKFMLSQAQTMTRINKIKYARGGSDFDHSDIVGSVLAANTFLGSKGKRFLILNTDAVDRPGKQRKPRTTSLTSEELDTGIVLIFVNINEEPEKGVLFSGVSNPKVHTDSIKEAIEYINKRIDVFSPTLLLNLSK